MKSLKNPEECRYFKQLFFWIRHMAFEHAKYDLEPCCIFNWTTAFLLETLEKLMMLITIMMRIPEMMRMMTMMMMTMIYLVPDVLMSSIQTRPRPPVPFNIHQRCPWAFILTAGTMMMTKRWVSVMQYITRWLSCHRFRWLSYPYYSLMAILHRQPP